MATAIAVAGLAEYLIEHFHDEKLAEREANQEAYSKFVKRAKRKIEETEGSNEFKVRAKQEIFGKYETAKERVKRAGEIVSVLLSEEDLRRWVKMRNKAAHPDFETLSYDERNERLEASIRIFLQLIRGYVGWTDSDDIEAHTS